MILSKRFCSFEVISTNLPYDLARNTVFMSGLVLLLVTRVCRLSYRNRCFGRSFATSLEPLALRQQVATLILFDKYYFVRCSIELAVHWRFILYSDFLLDFSVAIPRCYKDVYANSFFSCTVRL